MKNVGRCPRCGKFLIEEEYPTHKCKPKPKPIQIKEIMIRWHTGEIESEQGDTVIIAEGLDGILYRLVECKHKPLHISSDENLQRFKSDKDFTEPVKKFFK